MLNKIREREIDLFILVKDEMKNLYVVEPFQNHADYNSFQLRVNFEDWTSVINDGKEHIHIVAVYANANDEILVKFQNEDFYALLDEVKTWNDSHRILNVKPLSELPDHYRNLLYKLKLKSFADMSVDELINKYRFITVDGTVYCADDELSQSMLEEYKEYYNKNKKSYQLAYIPYAIIKHRQVIKNRYGKVI